MGSDAGLSGAGKPQVKNEVGLYLENIKTFLPLLIIITIIAIAFIILKYVIKNKKLEERKIIIFKTILYYTIILILILCIILIVNKINEKPIETQAPFIIGNYNNTYEFFSIKVLTNQYYNKIEFCITLYDEHEKLIGRHRISKEALKENEEYTFRYQLTDEEVKTIKYFEYEIETIEQGIKEIQYNNLKWYYVIP